MIYICIDTETGEHVEVDRPMTNPPRFGEPFAHGMRTLVRPVDMPNVSGVTSGRGFRAERTGEIVASSLPQAGTAAAKALPPYPRVNAKNQPVFHGQREVDRWLAKGGGDRYVYDKAGNHGG